MLCYTIIQWKYNSMITIQCKNISVLILRAGQLRALVEYTSRLEGNNNIVGNRTNLIRTSNKYCNKYNLSSTFFQENQSVNSCLTGNGIIWTVHRSVNCAFTPLGQGMDGNEIGPVLAVWIQQNPSKLLDDVWRSARVWTLKSTSIIISQV